MIGTDIANSQPLILTTVILAGGAGFTDQTYSSSKSFRFEAICDPKSQDPAKPEVPTDSTTYTTRKVDVSVCKDRRLMSFPEDLAQWKRLCESGRLYPYLMDRMNWEGTKAQFKDRELFRVLYGRNTPFDQEGNYNPSRLRAGA